MAWSDVASDSKSWADVDGGDAPAVVQDSLIVFDADTWTDKTEDTATWSEVA